MGCRDARSDRALLVSQRDFHRVSLANICIHFFLGSKIACIGFGDGFPDFLDLPLAHVQIAVDRLLDQVTAIAVIGFRELIEQGDFVCFKANRYVGLFHSALPSVELSIIIIPDCYMLAQAASLHRTKR